MDSIQMENQSPKKGKNKVIENEDELPKKRGRKARGAKLITKNDTMVPQIVEINTNVILHLKCCTMDLMDYNNELNKMVSDPLTYNPNLPLYIECYNNEEELFTSYHEDTPNEPVKIEENVEKEDTTKESNVKELNLKIRKLKIALCRNNIPVDKISACFWCSYDFDNSPCYIPKYQTPDMMYGYGSFCRPECAAAYLFKENIDDSTKFERYQMLNNLYAKVYDYKRNIKPAPDPHYLLDKFYGQLSIQEYRKLLKTQHTLCVVEKPMTRILPELHEDCDDLSYKTGNSGGVYKVKRESDRQQGISKTNIIRDKFGLSQI